MHFQVKMQDDDRRKIFIDKHTKKKVTVTFIAVIKKEISFGCCIQSVIWKEVRMIDAFSSWNARKREKEHI